MQFPTLPRQHHLKKKALLYKYRHINFQVNGYWLILDRPKVRTDLSEKVKTYFTISEYILLSQHSFSYSTCKCQEVRHKIDNFSFAQIEETYSGFHCAWGRSVSCCFYKKKHEGQWILHLAPRIVIELLGSTSRFQKSA